MATYVAVFALILAYVALVAAYLALRTLARLRRATAILSRGARGPQAQASIVEATQRTTERVEIVAEEIAELRGLVADGLGQRREGGRHPSGLRNLALVRYDAFGDLSGRLSFSLALLDDAGDGVTISAITGATDTRVYAKGVNDGKGEHELSPEERQAVSAALDKRRLLRRKSA